MNNIDWNEKIREHAKLKKVMFLLGEIKDEKRQTEEIIQKVNKIENLLGFNRAVVTPLLKCIDDAVEQEFLKL